MHAGTNYYFCNEKCLGEFAADPAKYLGGGQSSQDSSPVGAAMSRDPVCGMKVAEAAAREAGRFSKCQSATFYFCNDGCKKRFDANPAQFLNASQPPRSHPAVASGVSLDPVCGMKVTEAKARAAKRFSDLAGRTYFFCNDSCKEEFDANPARFVKNVIRESPPDD